MYINDDDVIILAGGGGAAWTRESLCTRFLWFSFSGTAESTRERRSVFVVRILPILCVDMYKIIKSNSGIRCARKPGWTIVSLSHCGLPRNRGRRRVASARGGGSHHLRSTPIQKSQSLYHRHNQPSRYDHPLSFPLLFSTHIVHHLICMAPNKGAPQRASICT